MQSDNLISLKDDMVAFIAGHGMRRMNGYISEEVPTVTFEEENPDGWKDFVELVSQRLRALGYARPDFERLVSEHHAQYERLGVWGVNAFGDLDRDAKRFQWEREA